MSELTTQHMGRHVVTALERIAFVLAETVGESSVRSAPTRGARIEYAGPSAGTLVLATTDDVVRGVAAGLLGVDPSTIDAATQGQDALNELANMVGGALIADLGAAEHRFDVGLPRTVDPAGPVDAATLRAWVESDSGVIEARWLERAAAA